MSAIVLIIAPSLRQNVEWNLLYYPAAHPRTGGPPERITAVLSS